ncbi:MAG: hypothetical protein HN509_12540, partial [Halobacteriovoraceae bacterium]|nr:hypothetical protein [Halobacteriovoraceae bacterium]
VEEELRDVDKEILPEHMTGKVGKKVDIEVEEEEEELRDVDKEILPEHMTGKVGKKLEVEVEDEEEELKDKLEDHQAENLVDRKQRKADEIEKYLKSKNLHKSNDEISDLDDIHKKEKQVSLEVEEEEKEREGHSEDLGTKADRLKKGATLDIEEEPDELKEGSGKGDESDGHMRSKKLSAVEEEEKKKRKRVNARADKIETHYSSKKGIKHGDQNWDGLAQEADWDEQPEEKLEEFEKELIYEQKDLGEQTIDYKKIKADFDTIKYEKLDDKIKIVETEDGPVKKKTRFVKKKVINSLWEDEDILFEELIEDDEDEYIPPVFEPNSCGLEFAIEALNMCYDDQLEDVDFFKYIAETVLNEKDGLSAFYFYESKSKMFYDGYIGHLELETDDPDDEKEEAWEELSEENLAKWQESTLPVWKDATFQEEENEFIYPFFEGQNNMGFAVVHFENQISQDDAKFIEVLLESARGIYLTNSHAAGGKGVYGEKKKKETAKLSKGLMGSLFGRKAG